MSLRSTMNALRKPTPTGWRARTDIQLELVDYKIASRYASTTVKAEERSRTLANDNETALASAEEGLVRIAQNKGQTLQTMDKELIEIAERRGLFGPKRKTKPAFPKEDSEANNQ